MGKVSILDKITEQVLSGETNKIDMLIDRAIKEGISIDDILDVGLLRGMQISEQNWANFSIFIPELLLSSRAMSVGIHKLSSYYPKKCGVSYGKVVIGTVEGDLHDIGKNIVIMMLEGRGFEVVDVGIDVTSKKFLEAISEHSPDILGMSALLSMTISGMQKTIDLITKEGLRENLYVLIGGGPVTPEFASFLGVDYARDGRIASTKAVNYMKSKASVKKLDWRMQNDSAK